jgi:voltage-gated potassium channel
VIVTTVGFGDVVRGPGWRVLAGIEGLTGLIPVGWSTAFVLAVVSRMCEHWRQMHEAP